MYAQPVLHPRGFEEAWKAGTNEKMFLVPTRTVSLYYVDGSEDNLGA